MIIKKMISPLKSMHIFKVCFTLLLFFVDYKQKCKINISSCSGCEDMPMHTLTFIISDQDQIFSGRLRQKIQLFGMKIENNKQPKK